MNQPRETQFNALTAKVNTAQMNGAPTFQTCGRKFRQWDQVASSEMPCCFVTKGFEHASQERTYGETKWRVKAVLYVYCLHSPDDPVPGALLNNVLDSLDQSLQPGPNDDRQTLGGVVTHAYIDGEVIVAEGMQSADLISIAVVPVCLETGI